MIPVSSSPLLLFLKVMHNGRGNYLQTEETTTLITANLMYGRLASAAKSVNYFIFFKDENTNFVEADDWEYSRCLLKAFNKHLT